MTIRAVAKKADWSKLASQVYPTQLPKLNKLKSQVDATATKVASLPSNLPKIDWAHYKAHAANPKLVEELEKKYTSLKVEAPKVPAARMNELKSNKEQDLKRFGRFVEYAKSTIESAEVVKDKFKNMIPIHDMTPEDRTLTFPDWSHNYENPSLWPHYGRIAGLSREEVIAFEQPDPLPYSTKTAWKEWEERKKKHYS